MYEKKRRLERIDRNQIKKVKTEKIEGEYILKNTDRNISVEKVN